MSANKYKIIIFTGFIFCFICSIQLKPQAIKNEIPEKYFVLFVAGRNNSDCYVKNLDSIFNQKYNNYHVIYVDDASTDGTGQLVEEYIKKRGVEDKVTLIINEERRYKMANQYDAIHNLCQDSDIVVEIDADDWLLHDHALSYLNNVFSDSNIWFTYSRLIYYPSGILEDKKCNAIPKDVIKNNGFRKYRWSYTGLLSYYAGLFKLIKKDDLIYKGKSLEFRGKFTPISSDFSIILPMIEMSRNGHFRYIKDPLYIYNLSRDEVYSEKMKKTRKERNYMLRKMISYEALDNPIWQIS